MTKQNYFLLVVLALLSICVLSETNLRSERAANIPTESKDDEVKILKKKEAATPLEYMLPKKRKLQDPGALARLMDVTRVEFSDGGGRYCIGFSPYVEDYAPGMSPPRDPPRELVDRLMTNLVNSGRIKCILSYGVNADVVSLAQEKGLEVILGTWIDIDPNVNAQQTEAAIELAKRYPETVIAVICGWEVRLRHNRAVAVDVVNTCYRRMKDAGLTIPITHMASWPEWCDEEFPGERFPQCGRWSQIDSDAVLVTAYSWWENQVVDPVSRFPCIVAEESANFHLDRLKKVIETYPDKPVILSEFGWCVFIYNISFLVEPF